MRSTVERGPRRWLREVLVGSRVVRGRLPERVKGERAGRQKTPRPRSRNAVGMLESLSTRSDSIRLASSLSTVELQVHPLSPAKRAITLEGLSLILETQDRPDSGSPERIPEHLEPVAQREERRMDQGHREMLELDPPIGPPSQEFDLVRVEVRRSHHSGGAVVVLEPLVDDESLLPERLRHRRARIGRRMLDVRYVDVPAGEGQIGLDRLARVLGVAHDEPADDVHLVRMAVLDCGYRGVAAAYALAAAPVLGLGTEEFEIFLEDVLDAQEDVPEARLAHQGRQRAAVVGDGRGHRLHGIVEVVEPGLDDGATEPFEPAHVRRDVVVDEADWPGG